MARSTTQRLGTTSKPSTSRETLDHLDPPSGIVHGPAQLLAAIGAVGEDRLKERKKPAGPAIQDQQGAVTILDIGRMDGRVEDQTEGVDEKVALLALDFLARIIARRVYGAPPFSVLLTLWLSITPAEGLASRPSSSRAMT